MVEYATQNDVQEIKTMDKHISEQMLEKAVSDKRVIVFKSAEIVMGTARWSFFWDSIPFLNMLFVPDGYTHHGVGTELLVFWENEMITQGYERLFTSTMARESGQHFFRKHGYHDIGNLFDDGEGLELILEKKIAKEHNRTEPESVRKSVMNLPHCYQPQNLQGVSTVMQLKVTGGEAFECYLTLNDDKCCVSESVNGQKDMIVTADSKVWGDILKGKYTAQKAFMTGQLKVRGNFVMLTKFDRMFAFGTEKII